MLGKALLPLAREFWLRLAALLLVPALFYYATFVLHFYFLPHSGPGDKFHTADFRCMLDGPPVASQWELKHCSYKGCTPCASLTAPTTWGAIRALNAEMLSANAHIKTGHAFGSGWAGWPLGSTPVFYWQEAHQGMWCKIYMAANPVIWRAALALCALLVLMLVHDMASLVLAMPTRYASAEHERRQRRFILNGWLLLIGYLVAWLPFAMVERVAFLYHYIPPLLLTFLGAGIAFDLVTVRLARLRPFRPLVHYGRGSGSGAGAGAGGGSAVAAALDAISLREVLCALLLAVFAVTSCYFAPLYFGLPMQPDEQARRVKRLDTWLDGHAAGSLFSFMTFKQS